jgi:hypothetical protein
MNVGPTTGTRERKRAARAVPPALEPTSRPLALVVLLAFVMFCWLLYWQRGWWVWLLVAIPAASLLIVLTASLLYEIALLVLARLLLSPRGIRCVVVHSQSPLWQDRIAATWLPRLGKAAVTLDWTQRGTWRRTLAVALFHRFCGQSDFNPAVIVFRGVRRPYVFRFRRAFHEVKRGRLQYVHALEDQMFHAVEAPSE